ncbi:hypothetical protein TPSD3_03425 [Thioflexithrix psekupsensis]|uniref:Uncharacterized protein n=1 Tax=Thioflexithrix psekupsensis TaxID=1570016 RepID=A0A251XBB2_9GAMM|nr:hypothetical protein TPSD3_03425 [Thioflexithrix psekupsensis]
MMNKLNVFFQESWKCLKTYLIVVRLKRQTILHHSEHNFGHGKMQYLVFDNWQHLSELEFIEFKNKKLTELISRKYLF